MYLDILPGMYDLHGRTPGEPHVSSPRVEVGSIRLNVLGSWAGPVRVEDELVGGEEQPTHCTLDALGSGGVVPGNTYFMTLSPYKSHDFHICNRHYWGRN